ncbi:Hypothetical predicted protein [Cloeon dipterum]|uniref:Uncharacterized protein n=1 Tax=Cloeon dipterum TaxID=197152 RepID=A0A8S1DX66_9INSE|nr:Hypothetical predicted protein [Cloeon dipterum]
MQQRALTTNAGAVFIVIRFGSCIVAATAKIQVKRILSQDCIQDEARLIEPCGPSVCVLDIEIVTRIEGRAMMLRGPAVALTEYEDNINFDLDDPDFGTNENCRSSSPALLGMGLRRGSRSSSYGSSASLVTLELPTTRERRCSGSSCASFDGDLAYLSIESLRSHLSSCFTCGVSWVEEHVSLDCPECGGYSMERPCPNCDGNCEATWTRDFASSHASGKARWEGVCSYNNNNQSSQDANTQPRIILRSIVDLTISDNKPMSEKKTSS